MKSWMLKLRTHEKFCLTEYLIAETTIEANLCRERQLSQGRRKTPELSQLGVVR